MIIIMIIILLDKKTPSCYTVNMNYLSTIISITDLRRNFGALTKRLPEIDELILTRGGEPFATLKAVPGIKRKLLKNAAGSWKHTLLDDDKIISAILTKKSRVKPIAL